ncbi:MAG: hypothetical protein ACTSWX_16035 [Promethearchaeota archaeon]
MRKAAVFALEDQDPKEASKILLDMAVSSFEKELAETAVYVLEGIADLENKEAVNALVEMVK